MNKTRIFLISSLCVGCVIHKQTPIIVVRNNFSDTIGVMKSESEIKVNDNFIYDTPFYTSLYPNEERRIAIPDRNLEALPDSSKMYFYIFNLDSIRRYQKAKKIQGIFKNSFLKRHVLQLNEVDDLLDTINVK